MFQQSSIDAYLSVIPSIGERQRAVYAALAKIGPASNMEIAQYLRWSVNQVTPRIFELRKIGWVIDDGLRECKITGRVVHVWRAR